MLVLSNNDGCAIARSEGVKALGVKIGEPFLKNRPLMEKNGVRVFSSNYVLDGDMSRRVNDVLNRFSPEVETYSIDETFLDLSGFDGRDLCETWSKLRNSVMHGTLVEPWSTEESDTHLRELIALVHALTRARIAKEAGAPPSS